MKTIKLILVLVLLSLIGYGQICNFKDVQLNNEGTFDGYITKSGELFKVGDTITIGTPIRNNSYTYITSNIAGIPMNIAISGKPYIIKKIKIKSNDLYVNTFPSESGIGGIFILRFDKAIESGEIVSKLKIPTEDEALTQLKKEKDKLDLGLITPDQYEDKKTKLSKYIN